MNFAQQKGVLAFGHRGRSWPATCRRRREKAKGVVRRTPSAVVELGALAFWKRRSRASHSAIFASSLVAYRPYVRAAAKTDNEKTLPEKQNGRTFVRPFHTLTRVCFSGSRTRLRSTRHEDSGGGNSRQSPVLGTSPGRSGGESKRCEVRPPPMPKTSLGKNTTAGLSSGRFTHKILFSHGPHGPPTTRRELSPKPVSRQSPVLVTGF